MDSCRTVPEHLRCLDPKRFKFESFSAGSQIPLGYKLAKHIPWYYCKIQGVKFISEYAGIPVLQLAQMNYTEVEDPRNPAVIQQGAHQGLTASETTKEWPSVSNCPLDLKTWEELRNDAYWNEFMRLCSINL